MIVAIDPQIAGVYDDGSESGAVRARITQGDLLKLPFHEGQLSFSPNCSFKRDATGDNGDLTSTTISVAVAPGTNAPAATIRFPFYGPLLGVRWDRQFDVTQNDFGVLVDGVAYHVPAARLQWDTQAVWNVTDSENRYVVARDLGDGPHWCDLVCPADPSVPKKWLFYGYLADRRAGYAAPGRARTVLTTTTLTTGNVALNPGAVATRYPRGYKQIIFYNTSKLQATAYLSYNGTDIWAKAIAAGDTVAFDIGDVLVFDYSSMKARASAPSSIAMTLIGGF